VAFLKKKSADTEAPEEASAKQAKPTQQNGLIGLTSFLTVFILIAILVSTAVQLFNSGNANHEHREALQKSLGNTYLKNFNHSLESIQQATNRVAQQEDLFLILKVADKSVVSATEARIKAILPYAVNARIIPLGRAQLDTQSDIPLTFAGLDMIKRSEKGQETPIEFHNLNKTLYIQSISPINNDQQQQIGSLLVTYDTYSVFGSLSMIDPAIGDIKVEQSFSNASPQILLQTGQGNREKFSFSSASVVPHLSLTFSLSERQMTNPLVSQGTTLISGAIAALLALIGIICFHYIMNNKLNQNMHMLSEFTMSLAGGRKPKLPDFSLGQFATLAQALFQQTRRNGPEMVSNMIASAPETFENTTTEAQVVDDLNLDLDLDDASMDLSDDSEHHAVSRQIFRAYDIRGRVSDQLTPEAAELIGQAIGSEAYERGQQTLYVGYDGRLSSPDIANALINGLKSTGRDVIDIGQVATPVVYFAAFTQETHSGVMITGSHNPPEYNGIKIVIDGESLHDDSIRRLYERITDDDLLSGEGSYHKVNLDQEYIDRIISDIAIAQPLKVVVDAGNGVAGQYAPKLFEAIGCDVIPLYCEVDGNFPNHHPDPTIADNLKDLIACVKGDNADLGIAFDGDGDRIVVIDDQGNLVQPDQLMMMFSKDVLSRCPGTDIVYDVKCSSKLGAYISQQGGRPVVWKSGHSLIKSKMQELGATFGGEMSGHLVFNERWYGFDDGLYAAARLLELLSTDHRPVSEVFKAFPLGHITPEYYIEVGDQMKFEMVAKLKEQLSSPAATLTEIDGIRVDYDNGWGLVRASNTTPTLTLRFEGNDEESLKMIMDQFKESINNLDPSLQIPF